MKVLILPFDVASKGPLTLDALNKIEGVEARGLFVNGNDDRTARSSYAKHIPWVSFRKHPMRWLSIYLRKSYEVQRLIRWADVLHWIWDSGFEGEWDLRLAKLLNKPGVIEWSGSDIRYPERNFEINEVAHLLYTPAYEFNDIETREKSFKRQEKFKNAGFVPLVTPEMSLYVRNDLFAKKYLTLHRLNIKAFKAIYPENERPLIVHSPTRRNAKGSQYVIDILDSLKGEYDFDFKLIERMPRAEALKIVQHCDIFIDQLLLGSNGMASCEAMSMGKPVLCHIMPAVYDSGLPRECPIIPTTPNNLKENLVRLLSSKELRIEKGKQGRAYAERFLDVDNKALELVEFYKEVIARKKQLSI